MEQKPILKEVKPGARRGAIRITQQEINDQNMSKYFILNM